MRVLADAGKNIEHFATERAWRIARRWSRAAARRCCAARSIRRAIAAFFAPHEMPLEFDVDRSRPKISSNCRTRSSGLGSARVSRAGRGVPPRRTFFAPRFHEKFATARRHHQHARRVRYPESGALHPIGKERDQSSGKFLQLLPAHDAPSFFAPQMRLGEKRAEIFVAGPVLHQHRQNGCRLPSLDRRR